MECKHNTTDRSNGLVYFIKRICLGGNGMPEKVVPGPICEDRSIREAVCIHTRKIFDSCKEKDIASLILCIKKKIRAYRARRTKSR